MPTKQHGQIRGYQVHYVRMVNGEPTGQPVIKDMLIDDAQVQHLPSAGHFFSQTLLFSLFHLYIHNNKVFLLEGRNAKFHPDISIMTCVK